MFVVGVFVWDLVGLVSTTSPSPPFARTTPFLCTRLVVCLGPWRGKAGLRPRVCLLWAGVQAGHVGFDFPHVSLFRCLPTCAVSH